MSSWLSAIIGQGIAANIGATGLYGPGQATQLGSQQGYNTPGQATQPGLTGFGSAPFGQYYNPSRWMIDGKSMTFEEFTNTLYPEDCAEKTMFILRFKKGD